MTPEEKAMLEEIRDAVLENKKMLQKMQRSGRTNRILQYCYWGFIIFGSIAATYFGLLYANSITSAVSMGDTTTAAPATTATGNSSLINNLMTELQQYKQSSQ